MKTLVILSPNKRKSAFTLIEIMVATVIMVVLVGLVIQITSEVLKVWNRSSGKLSANAEARIALDLLTQDLETAVFRNNGMRWLEAVQENVGNPLTGSQFKTTKLKLFSPALDRPDDISGDICAIAYLLDYRNPINATETGDQTFILYRSVINPKVTFNQLMGDPQQKEFNNTEWSEDSIRSNGKNYLVSNVVDFQVNFYVIDPDGTLSPNTKITGDVLFGGDPIVSAPTVGSGAPVPYNKPLAYADIVLTVISDEALQVIQNNDQYGTLAQSGFNTWDEYVAANSEVFTRRVNFLARPL